MKVYDVETILEAIDTNSKSLEAGIITLPMCQSIFEAFTHDCSAEYDSAALLCAEKLIGLCKRNPVFLEGGENTLEIMRLASRYGVSFAMAHAIRTYGDQVSTKDTKVTAMLKPHQFEQDLIRAWEETGSGVVDVKVVRAVLYREKITALDQFLKQLPDLVLACTYYRGR